MRLCELEILRGKKNLLAFSHGSDSTALFHALLQTKIEFSAALFNYKTRPTSDLEEAAARELCERFGVEFFAADVENFRPSKPLKNKNFESFARGLRYDFFLQLSRQHGFCNLLTAHNLNDNFEWFLMQIARAGTTLGAMQTLSRWEGLNLVRPLLLTPKSEILEFLKAGEFEFFEDESNHEEAFLRNRIRRDFATPFVREFELGVRRVLTSLASQKEQLQFEFEGKEFFIFSQENALLKLDLAAKRLGVVTSLASRKSVLQTNGVLSGKIAVCKMGENFATKEGGGGLYAAFLRKETTLSKEQKERFRKAKIPPLMRGFLAQNEEIFRQILEKFGSNLVLTKF